MLTKDYVKEMNEDGIVKYVKDLLDVTCKDLAYLQSNQIKIKINPENYEDKIEEIRLRVRQTKSDLSILENASIKKPLSVYHVTDNIKTMIIKISSIINVVFFKYESKNKPIRKFRELAKNYTDRESDLYIALMSVCELYESLAENQKRVSALCERARKNAEFDTWYVEMSDLHHVTEQVIQVLNNTGKKVINDEDLSHTIYEVLIYEYSIMKCKMDRYVVPHQLRNV